ncbi:choice-of-anchor M domain-containing protein [Cerasicoccus maritimus]|uniref:choice-of-anchor M domain-containing protein n=1 Tax=Cerasicoccus maritimus TaxID=490089 RepID=UPI0028526865|nr:choice-of-anchor M domain-containing protein [Cerasicoccus maritimus]
MSACLANGQGSILIDGHADVRFNYESASSTWGAEIVYGSFENPENFAAFDQVAFPLEDIPYTSGGPRYSIPNSGFEFLGGSAGSPVWIAPQSDGGFAWPGFRNEQELGAIASYTPSDSRVSSQGSQSWIKMTLVEVDYSGEGEDPQVSLWQNSTTSGTVVWAATSDGLDSTDAYYQLANGHSHLNWGFTEKGIYRLGMQASAYAGEGMTDPTQSEVEGVIFAVGTYAIWKATYFSGGDLFNEAVTGATADANQDGVPLLLEYAFNLSPLASTVASLEPGVGVSGLPALTLNNDAQLQIEYVRRKDSGTSEITYEAQFASGLSAVDWQTATEETVTSIDDDWERVVVIDPTEGALSRFGRVLVVLGE